MKKRITGFTFAAIWLLSGCNQVIQAPAAKAHAWTFIITPQTTLHNIDSVSMAWKKDSIELKFTQLEFSDDGSLSIVSGSVNFIGKDKFPSGSFRQDSICKKSLQIKIADNPASLSIGDK